MDKSARTNAVKNQSRVRERLEIVSRISKWEDQVKVWYRAQPIAAFGNRTAEELVNSGQTSALRDYLDHLAIGGYS